jgi:hypothetical protein
VCEPKALASGLVGTTVTVKTPAASAVGSVFTIPARPSLERRVKESFGKEGEGKLHDRHWRAGKWRGASATIVAVKPTRN